MVQLYPKVQTMGYIPVNARCCVVDCPRLVSMASGDEKRLRQEPWFFPDFHPLHHQSRSFSGNMSSFSDYLVTNDLTVLLGFIGVSVFLLQNFCRPQPLVHPILLGRQSDVGRVRRPTESAIYRNYGTGLMGRVCHPFHGPTGTVLSCNSAVPCQT